LKVVALDRFLVPVEAFPIRVVVPPSLMQLSEREQTKNTVHASRISPDENQVNGYVKLVLMNAAGKVTERIKRFIWGKRRGFFASK
jgi:hypothetical protein